MTMAAMQEAQRSLQLNWALYYHKLGWSVIPSHKVVDGECSCKSGRKCISPGKHPAVAWLQYQKERATEKQINEWFAGRYRDYGVGIITGRSSGNMFVVDVDEGPGKPGPDTLHDLQMEHDDLPETTQAKTGGGGRHYLFIAPPDAIIKTDRNILGPGVDTRGEGGFIVAAPSLHSSGRYYLWDEAYHPKRIMPAAAPEWLLNLVAVSGANGRPTVGIRHHNAESVNDFGLIADGRERYMVRVISGCIGSYVRENGALPEEQELFDMAWPTYSQKVKARGVSLEADGRGESLMRQRIRHMLRRAESGAFPVFQTVADEIANKAIEAGLRGEPTPQDIDLEIDGNVFPTLDFKAMASLPPVTFLIDDIITDYGFSIMYGDPGAGKSFLALDMTLHVAYGIDWHGRKVKQGAVIYIAGEGARGLYKRIQAWRAKHGVTDRDAPFRLIATSVNMLDETQTGKLLRTIDKVKSEIGQPVQIVVIDTVARALLGGDENTAQDMGAFVAACDTIRDATQTAVLGIHHSGKDKDRGARGSTALIGAVDTSIKVSSAENIMCIEIEKQKDAERIEPFRMLMEQAEIPSNGLTVEKSIVLKRIAPSEPGAGDGPDGRVNWQQISLIFTEIERAWQAGDPWSNAAQLKSSGRYLPRWCANQLGINMKTASDLIADWITNGFLEVALSDKKAKRNGLRVVKRLHP